MRQKCHTTAKIQYHVDTLEILHRTNDVYIHNMFFFLGLVETTCFFFCCREILQKPPWLYMSSYTNISLSDKHNGRTILHGLNSTSWANQPGCQPGFPCCDSAWKVNHKEQLHLLRPPPPPPKKKKKIHLLPWHVCFHFCWGVCLSYTSICHAMTKKCIIYVRNGDQRRMVRRLLSFWGSTLFSGV